MSLATASRYAPTFEDSALVDSSSGVPGLLQPNAPRPNYVARGGAVLLYAAALVATVTLGFRAQENPVEEQAVIELAPMPVDEPPPDDPPPPDEPDLPEPLPPEPEALAPLPEVKPPPPKPVERPKPKVEKERPRQAPNPAPAIPAARAPAAPPGATPSAIANHFHACMQRAAANAYPDSQAPRTARVGYRATFSASGSLLSYSITPSGNGAFDAVANRLGGRCGSVPAPGKSVGLSGSLTFSP